MRTLYLDCHMGAAGDMLTAALLELLPEPEKFVEYLNTLELPGVHFSAEKTAKCGITGTHMSVRVHGEEEESADYHDHEHPHKHVEEHHHHQDHDEAHHHHDHDEAHHHHDYAEGHHHHNHAEEHHDHPHHHHHSSLADVEHIVSHLDVSEKVKQDVVNVYRIIAEAEGHVHGKPMREIHFHEVGTMDAIADVTAVCLLMEKLGPERVVASEVHVGSGQVRCAHGVLPVPAPATAWILREVPTYGGKVSGELCTPTGAALLKYFVESYGNQPQMRVQSIGYGCGKKEFEQANLVRAMLGETKGETNQVLALSCNLDDMTPEAIGYATERFWEAGALDVYTIPIGMKKNRPGVLFICMCEEKDREEMLRLFFLHTTTLGVRESIHNRYVLKRQEDMVQTDYGVVRSKKASGWGVERSKWEYEDLARIAREQGLSLEAVRELLQTYKEGGRS